MAKIDRSPMTGETAPNFSLPAVGSAAQNETFELAKAGGNGVVLFFYPKDNTPGCTTEAIEFTKHLAAFNALGIDLIGISPDSIKKHDNFRAKHSLEVTLVSDEEKQVLEAYNVWVEKSMYGKKYMGVERSTFLIDGKGTILKSWRKVKVAGHVDEVLETATQLS